MYSGPVSRGDATGEGRRGASANGCGSSASYPLVRRAQRGSVLGRCLSPNSESPASMASVGGRRAPNIDLW
jgi:hypothetical protein